jgi:glutamate synthase (NADPH/NADH) large chain
MAFDEDVISLPVGGFYRLRAKDEPHALDGTLIQPVQTACNTRRLFCVPQVCNALEDRAPSSCATCWTSNTSCRPCR